MRTKRRFRINYLRLLLMLLCVSMIAYGVILLSSSMYEANRDGSAVSADAASDAETPHNSDGANAAAEENPFASFYYYEKDRQARYENYAANRRNLTPDEVVWRVNAELDRFPYTNIVNVTDFTPPVLLNKYRKLPDGYVPAGLVNTSSGRQMTAETKAAYESLRDAAGVAGHRISAASAYQSIEYQKGVYNKHVMEYGKEAADDFVARAGHSEHHLGTAIDLAGSAGTAEGFAGTKEAEWVAENAWRHGFIVRYTDANRDVTGYMPEPGHITWVGEEAAAIMHEEGIGSLEEYVVKYVRHKP
ncbi:MAG: M15 family metallopeptidase [Clostridiales Family XIII bacterium]|jgi:D-alanyl-D-alanine carboxypeptidase|nr:M15 family metallopeptidase [Clostridiales Family XIII bacterium]